MILGHEKTPESKSRGTLDERSESEWAPPSMTIRMRSDEARLFEADAGLGEVTEAQFGVATRADEKNNESYEPARGAGRKRDHPANPLFSPAAETGHTLREGITSMANNVDASLKALTGIAGFIGAAIVDAESGMALGTIGGNDDFDIDLAGAANTDVVSAKIRAAEALGLSDAIDDILITLSSQYHLIRPMAKNPSTFVYLAVNRSQANLAMTRRTLSEVEGNLKL